MAFQQGGLGMNWSSWDEFWSMGGDAAYVWGSFAVVGLILLAEWSQLAWRRRLQRRPACAQPAADEVLSDRKSTRLNSSHVKISYAVFCLKKKNVTSTHTP